MRDSFFDYYFDLRLSISMRLIKFTVFYVLCCWRYTDINFFITENFMESVYNEKHDTSIDKLYFEMLTA